MRKRPGWSGFTTSALSVASSAIECSRGSHGPASAATSDCGEDCSTSMESSSPCACASSRSITAPSSVSLEAKWCSIPGWEMRSEEHTSELQSRFDLVCRLLLEKKKVYI